MRATPRASALPSRPDQHKLKAYRSNIGCDYDKIPLHIMADFACKEGVALKADLERDECIPSNVIGLQQGETIIPLTQTHIKQYVSSIGLDNPDSFYQD
ncbi:hypothetical protein [Aliikangiella sp. IMCC44359]|uniref:hypothetical protein n=1 Tax=Aliikangiella sp. IMCC44359 TaxID=3459125 RepID=UPI00403ABFFA